MSPSSFERTPNFPSNVTFVTLPRALAQFHHLPTHVPVWTHRQSDVEKNGYDFNEGVKVMESLLKETPGIPGAYLFQLFVQKWPKLIEINPYFKSGRIAESIPKLVEVLEIDPECPLTCFQLGYCFRATGELEKSESFYLKALRMAPDAGWIYSNLGRTYLAKGDKAKAAEAFWRSFELLPGDHFVLEQLMAMGEVFALPQKDKDGADSTFFVRRTDYEKTLGEAVEKEEKVEDLTALGWKLTQDRMFDLACRSFEKARAKDERGIETLLGLGVAHLEAGRFHEAEKHLVRYLDEDPDSPVAHLNLFKAYLAQEERDLAWDEIQTAVRLDPDRLDAVRQLYLWFRESERKLEGLEWLDRMAEEHPRSYAPVLVKAQAFLEEDLWVDAEGMFRLALERAPHREEVLLPFSAELGKRGFQKEIIRLIEDEPEPRSLALTINLALAYSRSGQQGPARDALERFLEQPDLSRMDRARGEALLKEIGGDPRE